MSAPDSNMTPLEMEIKINVETVLKSALHTSLRTLMDRFLKNRESITVGGFTCKLAAKHSIEIADPDKDESILRIEGTSKPRDGMNTLKFSFKYSKDYAEAIRDMVTPENLLYSMGHKYLSKKLAEVTAESRGVRFRPNYAVISSKGMVYIIILFL